LFCVQDQEYALRFEQLSADPARILVTGNIKVDGLATGRVDPGAELVRLLSGRAARDGRAAQPVVVGGSTHEPEETWLAAAWKSHAREARLVIVPRHPERAEGIVRALES